MSAKAVRIAAWILGLVILGFIVILALAGGKAYGNGAYAGLLTIVALVAMVVIGTTLGGRGPRPGRRPQFRPLPGQEPDVIVAQQSDAGTDEAARPDPEPDSGSVAVLDEAPTEAAEQATEAGQD